MASLDELIGDSPGLVAVRTQVEQLLRRHSETRRLPPILILGETGTGKGLLARAVHEAGPRRAAAFVAVNCAAIPETLLEAELFGFERGAFTDAREAKAGLFQTADRGTLFLDEIGLLPENLQAKLLTALEDRAVRRLGSTRTEPVDVWIISATSEDLRAGARRRGFREELYHRLAVVTLRLPPLRARGQDILTLAEHFLKRTCIEYGLAPKTLTSDARAALIAYRWPGNVREVANVMERVALLVDGPLVTADRLELATPRSQRASLPENHETTLCGAPAGISLGQTVEEVERQRILEALHETRWNISRAASRLGVTRNILRYRVQKYGLRLPPTTAELTEPTDVARRAVQPTTGRGPVNVQWERRHVALLRADLVTTAVTAVPAAGAALDTLVEKIESFGGQVEEVSPAGLMAIFGLEPVEDAPRRAAHAALAIQKVAGHARGRSAEFPEVRVGLHLGEVLVARVGSAARVDHAAKREAWQQLEAFMESAEAGTVLVSEATRPFLERRFVLAPVAAGDGTAGTVCRLVGLERTGLGLGELLTPFVARSHELDQLARALELAQTGHGQIVAVVGEPGVGKSRLFWEFIESHRSRDLLILVSSAASYGKETPYLPVIDLLKAYFRIDPRDDADKVRERVTEKVLSLERALAPSVSAILALLDVPAADAQWQELDPQQKRRRTLEAVKVLLLEESRRQPVIVVFEDLHWIDSETQAVLDILVDALASHRVLLLISYRPEYEHRWGSKTVYSQLRLDSLPAESATKLLAALLGPDPGLAPLTQMLVKRGNPFFLEETVRTLVETGALAGERGAYRLTRPVEALQVPATVQTILAARIDRLPAEGKQLLQAASVIGKDVPYTLLAAIAEQPEEALRRGLAHLQEAEFLYETQLFPDLEHTFKHALTHEVTYGSLLQDRRRQLHAQIAAAIERLYADRLNEHVERLAHHALRGHLWDKAVRYSRQAGTRTLDRSAAREALAHFEQARAALRELPESRERTEQLIDLCFEQRNALLPLGEFERVGEVLNEGRALAEGLGDQRRHGWALGYLAFLYSLLGENCRAIEAGESASTIAETVGDLGLRVIANYYLGAALWYTSNLARAAEALRAAIALVKGAPLGERFRLAGLPATLLRFHLAGVLADLGEFAEAIAAGEEGLRIAQAAGHPYSEVWARFGLGYAHLRHGEFAMATRVLEPGLALCRGMEIRFAQPFLAASLGSAHLRYGRAADAVPLLEEAVEAHSAKRIRLFHSVFITFLAEAYLVIGRVAEAREQAAHAVALARAHQERGWEAWGLKLLGDVHAHEPAEAEQAGDTYRQALALATERGMRPLVAHCHAGLAKLYRRTGERIESDGHFRTATSMYREMGMTYWLEKAEAEAAAG